MKLRFTLSAERQLDRVLAYIAERNPQGARRVQARLAEVMSLLLVHPMVAPETARPPRRRLLATPYSYAITYRIGEGEIIILGIRHTARRPN